MGRWIHRAVEAVTTRITCKQYRVEIASVELRVKDFGLVSPLRSQSIWHALCKFTNATNFGPVLSFMRPASTYVSLGNHRSYQEINSELCSRLGIPIYRRMAGGGPVLIDRNQLFFQLTVPSSLISVSRQKSVEVVLAAVADAFNQTNVHCQLDSYGEIATAGRKLCGHGAMEIGGYMTVVGNLLEEFNFPLNSAILCLPWEEAREHVRSLMSAFVGPASALEYVESDMKSNIARSLGASLRLPLKCTTNFLEIESEIQHFDKKLSNTRWVRSDDRLVSRPQQFQLVKIRAGVYVLMLVRNDYKIVLSVVFGQITKISFSAKSITTGVHTIEHPSITKSIAVIEQASQGNEAAFIKQIYDLVNQEQNTTRRKTVNV